MKHVSQGHVHEKTPASLFAVVYGLLVDDDTALDFLLAVVTALQLVPVR
jgi:hypothetical protein